MKFPFPPLSKNQLKTLLSHHVQPGLHIRAAHYGTDCTIITVFACAEAELAAKVLFGRLFWGSPVIFALIFIILLGNQSTHNLSIL